MGERWVLIRLSGDETLRCHSCYNSAQQKAHLYIDVNDEIEEVMCDTCWKKNQKEIFG
jgi:hypothetical protein